jgi:hypothetical protein
VGFNTQDAFLERDPSADGLTKAFTHMSVRCNPDVPREIPKAVLEKLPPDPKIPALRGRVTQMSAQIKSKHRFICTAPENVRRSYRKLQRELKKAEKALKDDMTTVFQDACRRRLHNEELERQLRGIPNEETTPHVIQHHLKERNQLSSLMCDLRDDLSFQDMTDRKVCVINLLVRLASQREIRQNRSSTIQSEFPKWSPSTEEPLSEGEEIPLILGKTQCIYCVGNEQLPYEDRIRAFNRVSHMMDHVENVHLKYEHAATSFVCPHPRCKHLGSFLISLDHFKTHVQIQHGIKLRERRYMLKKQH